MTAKVLPKLCYVLPEYNKNTEQHFYHLYSFLAVLSQHYQIFLIVERGEESVEIPGMVEVWKQKHQKTSLRALEMGSLLWKAHRKGVRLFYTHYSSFGGFLAAMVTRFFGGRSYYWNCEVNKDHWVSWSLKNLKTKLKIEIPTYLTIYYSHHVVTGTITMARYYEKTYHLKKRSVRVMPNWLNFKAFQSLSKEGEAYLEKLELSETAPVLLFIHRMAPRKGAHYLTEMVRKIHQKWPNCQFLLVGAGPYLERLKEELKEESSVYITGRLPHRYLVSFYQRADIFMMPSKQEGFPRVLLEAMEQNLPFVCTDVGGVRDILTKKQLEFMVAKGDMDSFVEKIFEILESTSLRLELALEGKEQVKNFTEEIAIEAFKKIVRSSN